MAVASLAFATWRHRVISSDGEIWAAAGGQCPRVLCEQGVWRCLTVSLPSVTVRGLLLFGLCRTLTAVHRGLAIPMPRKPLLIAFGLRAPEQRVGEIISIKAA